MVSSREEDIVSLDPVRGVITARTVGQETMVGSILSKVASIPFIKYVS